MIAGAMHVTVLGLGAGDDGRGYQPSCSCGWAGPVGLRLFEAARILDGHRDEAEAAQLASDGA